ncbi:PHIKZ212 [Pseudomonas phage phiKZ]|uniref:PHIKZ212 n=1 Tax=Pseudomonas phage phiKZ TaxID=2905945 RepID=Q8SCV0_BPDPK|nr:PHIKZ212 [Pseudomonas phage phiKZ]AAL83113.1 PHIKZ212 [Pseudomonas phage phiKZ]
MTERIHYSDRKLPLCFKGVYDIPVVTIENYCKWYGLNIVYPDGCVEWVDTDLLAEIERESKFSVMGDHNYHPILLDKVAEKIGGVACEVARELMTGRWVLEVMDGKIPGQEKFC